MPTETIVSKKVSSNGRKEDMKRLRFYPWRAGSESLRFLTEALPQAKILHRTNSTYTPRKGDIVVNWGSSELPRFLCGTVVVLNDQAFVAEASNKLRCLSVLKVNNVSTVPFTGSKKLAEEWIDAGYKVVARRILCGSGGNGIELAETRDDLIHAPLYTRYVKKTHEYRVHVLRNGEEVTFHVQQKRTRIGEDADYEIRNLEGGWVYCTDGVEADQSVLDCARDATIALGLDFAAVDIIWNKTHGRSYVLEVNTAPGLMGRTVEVYADYFKGWIDEP